MNVNIKNFNLSVIMPNGDAKAEEKQTKVTNQRIFPTACILSTTTDTMSRFLGITRKRSEIYRP